MALSPLVDDDVARALAALPTHVNELGYDPWGFSPSYARVGYSLAKRFVHAYFRPDVVGIENVPKGRVLLVANHSGQLPLDGVVIAVTCLLEAHPPRLVRPMVERWFPRVPFINEVISRGGATLGAPINCRNLLNDEQAILVFPEGVKGSGKVWSQRYKLQAFGRGFMRLALQTNTPIVPIGVVGGEESLISVHNWRGMAKLLGMPYLPIPALLPVLGPLAFLPLPVKFYLRFGAPLTFEGRHDDDDAVIDAKVRTVTSAIDGLIEQGRNARTSLF